MVFEGLLKSELSSIEVLNDNIYPLVVPESVEAPYITYSLIDGQYLRTLDKEEPFKFVYEVNVLTKTHSQLEDICSEAYIVLNGLKGMISDTGEVKEIIVHVSEESYEDKVLLQRASITFEVYF